MVATANPWQEIFNKKADSGKFSEYLNEEAEELAEVTHYWSMREALVFCHRSTHLKDAIAEDSTSNRSATIDPQTRGRVLQKLHVLLSTCNVADDLPMALTLFDAICVQDSLDLPNASVTSVAVLIAVVRITLKTSPNATEEDFFHVEELAQVMERYGEELVTAKQILAAEVELLRALDGRIKLLSPPEWSRVMVDHLIAFGAHREALEKAMPNIAQWAAFLIHHCAATPSMPPKNLGMLACIMGLLNSGMLALDDLRPPNLTDEDWESTTIIHIGEDQQSAKDTIDVNLLSCVYKCSTEKLCQMAFDFLHLLANWNSPH
mmetsp:Transcript_14871/g.23530  ORF Transcript_14871/g.23530 Transcript_14871/m.23530 type:complete len:320 (+) Transcript_14871:61-1020(+)